MKLCTTSETISFGREMEERSAQFYREMLARFPEASFTASFPDENKKFIVQVQRAYQSVITDAIEGCFAFQLESDDFQIQTDLPKEASYPEALKQALAIEEKILDFYNVAADQSMALMADVPRNFKLVAKKRSGRVEKLKSLS